MKIAAFRQKILTSPCNADIIFLFGHDYEQFSHAQKICDREGTWFKNMGILFNRSFFLKIDQFQNNSVLYIDLDIPEGDHSIRFGACTDLNEESWKLTLYQNASKVHRIVVASSEFNEIKHYHPTYNYTQQPIMTRCRMLFCCCHSPTRDFIPTWEVKDHLV